jgi:hypothetical protein
MDGRSRVPGKDQRGILGWEVDDMTKLTGVPASPVAAGA